MSYIEDVTASQDWIGVAEGAHHDPHSVLGAHPETDAVGRTSTTLRVRRPLARSVEAVFEGGTTAVEAMVGWCRRGPSRAVVEDVRLSEEPPEGLTGFEVRPTTW